MFPSRTQRQQKPITKRSKATEKNTNRFIMQMVTCAMDMHIHSLVRRMRCIAGSAIAAKWAFVISLAAAYVYAGHVNGAVITVAFAILYDAGQQDILKEKYDGVAIWLGLSFGLAAMYLRSSGPVWHLWVIISVIFGLRYLRQHGFSYLNDIRTLDQKKDELTEEDIIGKSEIRVSTDSGRNYTFAWNRQEVERALQEQDESPDQLSDVRGESRK